MSIAIEFENVSKQYRLGVVSTGTLSHDLNRFWHTKMLRREDPYLKIGEANNRAHKGESEYVWALKDIDFKVEQGDVVGIIGKNGAGKSTLLKLLSRVTAPTTGMIRARGRIASLLEVGTGFHPEMTGRENIYMNGCIMGMNRSEITRKLDEIVDFSGCERYLDTPVKRYSSGMIVRLGFAIAAHLEPEILVVDEVLAVGDAEFQKKAIGKMQDVSKGEGRTVLFVSHNMGAVRNLCKTGVLLENGRVESIGGVENVIDFYQSNSKALSLNNIKFNETLFSSHYSLDVYFSALSFEKTIPFYASNEDIVVNIFLKAKKTVASCRINCTIINIEGMSIGSNTSFETFDVIKNEGKQLRYTIKAPNLAFGQYSISFSVGTGNAAEGETNFDVVQNTLHFSIDKIEKDKNLYYAKWNNNWGHIFIFTHTEEL